ncbi:MAG: DUF2442 domain-containing protein [Tannerella sp.]|nr:DUF2442 domain-containing protein [Tannerella sp.]
MNPTVTKVQPERNYFLTLHFSNGEIRRMDVKPYLDKGIFRELKTLSSFNSVNTDGLGIVWNNEASLSPYTVYSESIPVS